MKKKYFKHLLVIAVFIDLVLLPLKVYSNSVLTQDINAIKLGKELVYTKLAQVVLWRCRRRSALLAPNSLIQSQQ